MKKSGVPKVEHEEEAWINAEELLKQEIDDQNLFNGLDF